MSASHFFSKDYFQARDRFIKSINELKDQGHQVSHDTLTLDQSIVIIYYYTVPAFMALRDLQVQLFNYQF